MAIIGTADVLPSERKKKLEGLTEIPNKVRFLVEAAPNIESKVATLEKFYDNVQVLEGNNFIVTDSDGNQYQLDNKDKTNLGDVIDVGKEITEMVGSMIGTTVGGTAGSIVPGAGTAVGAVAGSGAGMAIGGEIFERVGQAFGAEMLRTNKEWAAQRGTDFAFGSVGQAVAPLILKPLKGAVTGFGKKGIETATRLKDYINAGVTPSLGQVTQKRGIQTVEMILGNFPGSSGKIATAALNAQNQLAKNSLNLAESLIGKTLPDEVVVGKAIQGAINGVNNPKSFVGMLNSRAGVLFGKVDKFIKPDSLVNLSGKNGTLEKLRKLTAPIKGAEKTSAVFKNQFLTDLFENLSKEVAKNNGSLPYAAVQGLKQKIGRKLASFDMLPDVDKGQLKLIYGALSEDLKAAIKKFGGDEAERAFIRANKFYAGGIKRIEDYLKPIMNIGDPDRIVRTLLNSGKEGVTKLRAVKRSLLSKDPKTGKSVVEGGEAAYKIFLTNILEKMGRLQPGQTLAGDFVEASGKFSSESFLTNWNLLSKAAREELFKGSGWPKSLVKDLDRIVNISSLIRQSGKTFKNPSGTADRVVGQGLILGGGISAFTGNPLWLAGIPLVIGSTRVVAGLMTNPNFIKWLSQGIKIYGNKGADAFIQHLGKLGTIMANSDSDTRQFIYEYLQMLQGKKEE